MLPVLEEFTNIPEGRIIEFQLKIKLEMQIKERRLIGFNTEIYTYICMRKLQIINISGYIPGFI